MRPGEELDAAALAAWLGEPVEIEQCPHGRSNLVYLIRTPSTEYVLRRPPLGPVAPKAHDMAREYRVLKAVHPHFPEAPRVDRLCEDSAVIGAPFFLMERRHGVVLRDVIPSPQATEAFVDCLVRLHAVEISPLRELGKPEGFVERQVRGWSERWRRAKTEDLPQMDRVIAWLHDRLPPSVDATLVHNDFKLDNVMLNEAQTHVDAVLDWEMATLGDPLADVGLSLCYWQGSRDAFVERYARQTGRDMTHLGYHEVLGIFKLAVILQQIYFRYQCGQTRDERFRELDLRVRALVERAVVTIERHS